MDEEEFSLKTELEQLLALAMLIPLGSLPPARALVIYGLQERLQLLVDVVE